MSDVGRQQDVGAPLEGGPKLSWESVKESLAKSAEAWHLYRSQEVFPAALALALNSLTVLNLVGPFCLTSIHLHALLTFCE